MNAIITERQQVLLEKYVAEPGMTEKLKKVKEEKFTLEEYIESKGEYMVDITNGKTYLVLYLKTLSEMVGKKYSVCAPVKNDGTYGAFYVKPLETFKRKWVNPIHTQTKPAQIKQNVYQRLGLNKDNNN